MTLQTSVRDNYITLFRNCGFNCFPIPENKKVADYRYSGAETTPNQEIKGNENYGIIPTVGNVLIDIDDKERYRVFAENMIKDGYMVVETGRGWQIPVRGLAGKTSKIELYDYNYKPNEKIIEIQGPKHYCVGPGCEIFHDKLKKIVTYENKGTNKIWDAKSIDFHEFIDGICKNCNVEARKKKFRSSYKNFRDRFLEGLPPTKGTSNDYFFQSAIQCNSDGLGKTQAIEKIKLVYDKWGNTPAYSNRPFSNIEAKINEVYEKDIKIKLGRPEKNENEIDRTGIALSMIEERKMYSNVETHEIFENRNGFLEKINDTLIREIVGSHPEAEQGDYNSILFKLEGLAEPMPATNKNLTVFKNGVYDRTAKATIETDEIGDMGFKDYNYLSPTKENEPKKFISIMFDNITKHAHPRIKAGLRSILRNRLDPRISIIHGESGVGKSTPLLILVEIMSVYALVVELDQLLDDKFIRAKIMGVRLLVLQDLPQFWKDFSQIKSLTGEQKKTERGFMKDSVQFENKLKIWASSNYLAKIPEKEKNSMYTRRLSLIKNIRKEPYQENPELIDEVVKEEGEKIISWILNLDDKDCKYEDSKTVREEWEEIASPEIEWLEKNYEIIEDPEENPTVVKIIKRFEKETSFVLTLKQMKKALEAQGFTIKNNIVYNMGPINPNEEDIEPEKSNKQKKL